MCGYRKSIISRYHWKATQRGNIICMTWWQRSKTKKFQFDFGRVSTRRSDRPGDMYVADQVSLIIWNVRCQMSEEGLIIWNVRLIHRIFLNSPLLELYQNANIWFSKVLNLTVTTVQNQSHFKCQWSTFRSNLTEVLNFWNHPTRCFRWFQMSTMHKIWHFYYLKGGSC